MYPDRKTAEALLTEAEPHNPGPWASPRQDPQVSFSPLFALEVQHHAQAPHHLF